MSLFSFLFKSQEEVYFNHLKKIILNQSEKEITISNLRVRVTSVQFVFKDLVLDMKKLDSELDDYIIQNDNKGLKKIIKEKEDLKLKITVVLKLKNEFEEDFVRGVSLKIKELVNEKSLGNTLRTEEINSFLQTEVPSKYVQCSNFIRNLSNEYYIGGRWIELEEIKLWK